MTVLDMKIHRVSCPSIGPSGGSSARIVISETEAPCGKRDQRAVTGPTRILGTPRALRQYKVSRSLPPRLSEKAVGATPSPTAAIPRLGQPGQPVAADPSNVRPQAV